MIAAELPLLPPKHRTAVEHEGPSPVPRLVSHLIVHCGPDVNESVNERGAGECTAGKASSTEHRLTTVVRPGRRAALDF